MSEKSIKKNAVFSFLKAFMTLVFPIITFPYASRILNPDGIGKINFANSIISYFSMLAGLGLGTYGIREVAKRRNDIIQLSKLVKELLSINLISTVISYGLFTIALFFIPKFSDYRTLLLICSFNIICSSLGMDWYYRGLEEFQYITLRSFIFQLISVAYLFIFVHTKEDLNHYAIVGVISAAGSNIFNIIHARKTITLSINEKLELKKHIKPLLVFFGFVLAESIYSMLDTSMVGFLSNDTQVGYYSAANKLNKMVLGLITAVIGVLVPRLSYYYDQKKYDEFNELANKSFRYLLTISIPSAAGLFLLASPIITLFSGEKYLPATSTMKILTLIVIFISLGVFLNVNILVSIGKEKYGFIAVISGAVVNFTLNYILILKFNAFGAGLSTVITEFLICMIEFIFTGKIFLHKQNLISLLKVLFSTFIMSLGIVFFQKINPNIYLNISISIIIGIVLYTISLLILREQSLIEILNKFKGKLNKNEQR